jgi:thioesterase domain-containing protein
VAPRTPAEQALAAIWQEVLALPAVGVHDDFFELGGQSFAALRMMTRIAAQFGRRLSLGALLEARTIARLAGLLAAGQAGSLRITLHAAGAGTPCFLVHPAGGSALCYRALAAQLQRPVHGLQAPGLQGQPQPDDLPALAALYVEAVREAQPSGPYLLGGWSSGGVIAYEMARQLEAQGETVAQLVMIDTPAPMQHDAVDPRTLARWFVHDLNAGRATGGSEGGEHDAALEEALRPAQRVFAATVSAIRRYHATQRGLGAGITVLRAAEGCVPEFAGHPAAGSRDWGWSDFTRGRVQAIELPGSHYTMLAAPHDAALLRALASAFSQAEGAGSISKETP